MAPLLRRSASGSGSYRRVLSVQRLSAHARLDDSPAPLAHARADAAAGDESWQQWVAEYQRGEALILQMELLLEFEDREPEVLRGASAGLFVESGVHAPKVERQVAELASGDFVLLGRELLARGHQIDLYELGAMYIHVELDEEVRRQLQARRVEASRSQTTEPASDSRT